MVTYDPLQAAVGSGGSFAHEPSNIWVIRKQTRRHRAGMDDEVNVLATYFVVGDCIYMAPSVGSVVGNRIVCCLFPRLCALMDGKIDRLTLHSFRRLLLSRDYSRPRHHCLVSRRLTAIRISRLRLNRRKQASPGRNRKHRRRTRPCQMPRRGKRS